MERKVLGWVGAGAGIGAALMYLMDPDRGRRRRARVRDRLVHTGHEVAQGAGTVSRDVAHRSRGLVVGPRAWFTRGVVDDAVLAQRVRSQLGRVVSHPHAIHVTAYEGTVKLNGSILADEVKPLLRRLRHLRGVQAIEESLQVHAQGEHVPGLQGGRKRPGLRRRLPFAEPAWLPAERFVAALGGAAAIGYGLRHRGRMGLGAIGIGTFVAARAASNLSVRRMIGVGNGRSVVETRKTLRMAAPVEHVYGVWSSYETFPSFMASVWDVVRLDDTHVRWRIKGPFGLRMRWESVLTAQVPNELLAWRTSHGAFARHSGIVRFRPDGDENHTQVDITMTYHPFGGVLGHKLARLLGFDPKSRLDRDLLRMKTFIETGTVPRGAAQRSDQASA